jgi:hypothetical protein
MEVLRSNADTRTETYRENRAGFLEQLTYLNEQLALARAGGGEKYVRRCNWVEGRERPIATVLSTNETVRSSFDLRKASSTATSSSTT